MQTSLKAFLVSAGASIGTLLTGAFFNAACILANHGFMPVVWPGVCFEGFVLDNGHICASAETNLLLLSDWIHIGQVIYSPGDGLLVLGQIGTVVTVGLAIWMGLKHKWRT
jgi:Family of unknown function (DUF5317)